MVWYGNSLTKVGNPLPALNSMTSSYWKEAFAVWRVVLSFFLFNNSDDKLYNFFFSAKRVVEFSNLKGCHVENFSVFKLFTEGEP